MTSKLHFGRRGAGALMCHSERPFLISITTRSFIRLYTFTVTFVTLTSSKSPPSSSPSPPSLLASSASWLESTARPACGMSTSWPGCGFYLPLWLIRTTISNTFWFSFGWRDDFFYWDVYSRNFIFILFWDCEWEVSTNPIRNKIVPKDPGIKNVQGKNKPIIPTGWLLLKAVTSFGIKISTFIKAKIHLRDNILFPWNIFLFPWNTWLFYWFDHNMLWLIFSVLCHK